VGAVSLPISCLCMSRVHTFVFSTYWAGTGFWLGLFVAQLG